MASHGDLKRKIKELEEEYALEYDAARRATHRAEELKDKLELFRERILQQEAEHANQAAWTAGAKRRAKEAEDKLDAARREFSRLHREEKTELFHAAGRREQCFLTAERIMALNQCDVLSAYFPIEVVWNSSYGFVAPNRMSVDMPTGQIRYKGAVIGNVWRSPPLDPDKLAELVKDDRNLTNPTDV